MPKALTTKQQYWSEHVQRAESFNGSMTDYAKTEGLAVQSLYRWRHYLSQTGDISVGESRATFTRVVSTAITHPASLTLAVGQTQLRFTSLPDCQWLAQLIEATNRL